MTEKIKLAILYGSNREGRLCDRVADWAAAEVSRYGNFELSIIDSRTLDESFLLGRADAAKLSALKQSVAESDGFIVVTPEYNHSYPAALKIVIDAVNEQWQAKPVAFVSYGGVSGGLRAVEHLRLVFAELHAVTMRDSVSFANIWSQFGPSGELRGPESNRRSMSTMLRRLEWWSVALRAAKAITPYEQPVG